MLARSEPPIIEPESFIQPGGLHGLAMIFISGLRARACRTRGMMSASSWAMENRDRLGSLCPGGRSSYE